MASFYVFDKALLSPLTLRLFQPVCSRIGPWHWRFTAKKYVRQRFERGSWAKELPFLACFACFAPLVARFARVGDVHSTIEKTLSPKKA